MTYFFSQYLGTGKTFIGALIARTILDNTSAKILCVCYTNHALDQFLEDLHSQGVKDIARIGGKSKSAIMEQFSVNNLVRTRDVNNRTTKRAIWKLHQTMDDRKAQIEELQNVLISEIKWESFQSFLKILRGFQRIL